MEGISKNDQKLDPYGSLQNIEYHEASQGKARENFQMDINQVSMSSIEPAANVLSGTGTGSANERTLRKVQVKKSAGHTGSDTPAKSSGEKGDDEGESGLEEKNIDEIPQFTIGPGSAKSNFAQGQADSVHKSSQEPNNIVVKKTSPALQIEGGRKYSLKKNAFESDLGLQTGRFHNESNQAIADEMGGIDQANVKDGVGLSKSANQAQALQSINRETLVDRSNLAIGGTEIDLTKQEYADVQEQEMRETSYFRHQTDDEHQKSSPESKQDQPKTGQVNILNQATVNDNRPDLQHEPMMSSHADPSQKTTDEYVREYGPTDVSSGVTPGQSVDQKSEASAGRQRFSRGSKNQNSHKEGIQMFKISSKSQMRQNRAGLAQRSKKGGASLLPQGSVGGPAISDLGAASEITDSNLQQVNVIEPFSPKSGVEFPPAMSEVSEQLQDLQHSVEYAQEVRSNLNLHLADFTSNFHQSTEQLVQLSPQQRDIDQFAANQAEIGQSVHLKLQQQNQTRRRGAAINMHQNMQNTPTSTNYARIQSSGINNDMTNGLGELGARSMKQQIGAMVLGPQRIVSDNGSQGRERSHMDAAAREAFQEAVYLKNMSTENLRSEVHERVGPISVREETSKQALNQEPNSAAAAGDRKQDYGMGNQNYLTGNFGALKLQKQAASGAAERLNYSVLKGPNPLNDSYARDVAVIVGSENGEGPMRQNSDEDSPQLGGGVIRPSDGSANGTSHMMTPGDVRESEAAGAQQHAPGQQQMFTSMSDIGFPQHEAAAAKSAHDVKAMRNEAFLQSKSLGEAQPKGLGSERNHDAAPKQAATLGNGLQGRGKLAEFTMRAQSGNTRQSRAGVEGEIITTEQISKLVDAQHNWRVRTMTIDQILHDVQERVEVDPIYMMLNSERLLDFFIQMLNDQNFKIVLNTLNVLNMIVAMKQQRERYDMMMRRPQDLPEEARTGNKPYGLSNAFLGRHIPQLVKKLADSKAIIRQEAIKCLFYMNEIMRSGNKKDNNFIALILPYLNNSSNWHIREELLNLLIRCFLVGNTDQSEFDCYQILDSILQLLNDNKEKIRNLALEAIAAFASIGQVNKISEVLFQLNIDKEVCDIVNRRLEQGMFPQVSADGQIDIPYLEQAVAQNFDVDSVAHSMTNQTAGAQSAQPPGSQGVFRRKGSVGGGSQGGINFQNQNQTPSHGQNRSHVHAIGMVPPHLISAQPRGNSSGRKIVVGTANATNQQQLGGGLLLSHQDEMIMQQAFMQSKRTASANAPAHLDSQFAHTGIANGALGMMLGNDVNLGQYQQVNFNNSNSGGNAPSSFNQSMNGAIAGIPVRGGSEHQYNQHHQGHLPQLYDDGNSSGGPHQSNYVAMLNGSSFLPSLQKFSDSQHPQQFSSYSNHRERMLNMGGGANSVAGGSQAVKSIGYIGNDMAQQRSGPTTKTQKRSNKYLHGTPGHQPSVHHHAQSHFGTRGNSGKIMANHPVNSVTSDQSPSLFDHQLGMPTSKQGRLASGSQHAKNQQLEMSGNMTSLLQDAQGVMDGSNGNFDASHFKQISTLAGSIGPVKGQPGRQFSQQMSEIAGQTNVASSDISEIQSLSGLQSQSNYNHYQQTPIQHMSNNLMDMPPQANNVLFSASSFKGSSNRGTRHMDHSSLQKNMMSGGIPLKGGVEAPSEMAYSQFENSQRSHFSNKVGLHQAHFTPDQHNLLRKVPAGGRGKAQLHAQFENASSINNNHGHLDQSLKLIIDNRRLQNMQPISTKTSHANHLSVQPDSPPELTQDHDEGGTINRSFSHVPGQHISGVSQAHKNKSAGLRGEAGRSSGSEERKEIEAEIDDVSPSTNDPALITQSSKIIYTALEDLEPLEKPEKEFKKVISKGHGIFHLTDWLVQFEGCDVIRRVCKHHQSLILQTVNQLQNLVGALLKLAESLRSAVSRISLITLQEMFISLKRAMEPCLDPVLKILLKKGSDTNQFIAQAADQCMLALVQHCQEQKVLQCLQRQNMWSGSSLYRLKICQCLQNIVNGLGNNILFFNQNDKLLVHLANYLTDASQDVRQAAKIAFIQMSQNIMGQNELERLLQRVLNEVQYKKVKEVLDKEPASLGAQSSHVDFVITASSQTKAGQKTHVQMGMSKASAKNQKQGPLKHSHSINLFKPGQSSAAQDKSAGNGPPAVGLGGAANDGGQAENKAPLSIQAKSFQYSQNKNTKDSKTTLSKQDRSGARHKAGAASKMSSQPITTRSNSRVP